MENMALLDRERLMVIRRRRALTQKQLATKAGLSYYLVAALESGARDNPTLRTLDALARALDVAGHELAPGLCRCPDTVTPDAA